MAHPNDTSIGEAESGGQLWVSRKQNQEFVLQGKEIKIPEQILKLSYLKINEPPIVQWKQKLKVDL